MRSKNWLELAREKSGLSPEQCAAAIECSRPTYSSREKEPGNLTLNEVRKLLTVYPAAGKEIVRKAITEFL